jgi:hypothetical protein
VVGRARVAGHRVDVGDAVQHLHQHLPERRVHHEHERPDMPLPTSTTTSGISATDGIGRRNSIVDAVSARSTGTAR